MRVYKKCVVCILLGKINCDNYWGNLVVGVVVGSAVENWLHVDIVPFFGIHSPLCCSGLDEDVPVVEVRDGESEKLKKSSMSVKGETDIGSHTLNMPLMEDNGGGSVFSSIKGKGLAPRPKSSSRIALAADADAVLVGLGDSVVTSLFDGVRKSSSTSNLQDQDSIQKSRNHNIVVAFIHGYCLIVNF
ncbi:hypothetical protein IFM89_034071 [Coptis chinensis]|uniref:Uncharacterized protein n=1 Tax=Coptis chinensis TaxID=261450 RepID=A0A835ISF4_9MAGN|nr:hypothetical protein IFM89_034071 [Coptis chinensis]